MAPGFSDYRRSDRLIGRREAAQYLAISDRHLWTITASGALPCIRIGRSVRYALADLDGFIESRRTGGAGA